MRMRRGFDYGEGNSIMRRTFDYAKGSSLMRRNFYNDNKDLL